MEARHNHGRTSAMSAQYYILGWRNAGPPCEDRQANTIEEAERIAVELVREKGYNTAVNCKALKQVNRAHEVVTL